MSKKKLHLYRREMILKIAKVLSWFDRGLVVTWLAGEAGRVGWVEYWLPRLVYQGNLKEHSFGKRKAYATPRHADLNIHHELECSWVLTKFYVSDRNAQILTPRYFRKHGGLGIIPDGGLVYPKWVLLWEYSTQDNCERLQVLRWKVNRYIKLANQRPNYQVVFVLDVPPKKLNEIIAKLTPHEALFYIDYQTFNPIPFGQQLVAPVYRNRSDGKIYPLRIYEHPTHHFDRADAPTTYSQSAERQ